MFTSKNAQLFSTPYFYLTALFSSLRNARWEKLLFILALCSVLFSSCTKDDKELTPEEIEEQRIEEQKKGIAGTWKFTSSEISTTLTSDSTDYRNIKTTLGAIGPINGSTIELDSDGDYKVTNATISGSTYVLSGKWELRKDEEFQADFIQLKGLYKQLLIRLNADRDLFSDNFAESFENFRLVSVAEDEIVLSNSGLIVEEEPIDSEPKNLKVDGQYTIVRQQ